MHRGSETSPSDRPGRRTGSFPIHGTSYHVLRREWDADGGAMSAWAPWLECGGRGVSGDEEEWKGGKEVAGEVQVAMRRNGRAVRKRQVKCKW